MLSRLSTPRGRRAPVPKKSTPLRSGVVNTPPQHMPRQSLFDRDQAFSMIIESNEEADEGQLPLFLWWFAHSQCSRQCITS